MPGSGKTTLGKLLSKRLNYNFLDMDEYIEEIANKSIKKIFDDDGEKTFRDLETKACKDIVDRKKLVISSGGGVIKKSINIEILKKDCIVVFVDRPIEHIINQLSVDEINSRPLLKGKKDTIYSLYEKRYELYKNACDIQVKNDKSLSNTINEVVNLLGNRLEG